jgi:hypothetical protein
MRSPIRWILYSACICLLSETGFAQAGYGSSPGETSSTLRYNTQLRAALTNTPSERFFHARSLVGQEIKDANDRTLGSVYDIAFNPRSGDTFVAIGVGGGRYAMVPWQALTLRAGARGQDELSLNTTLRDLQSGPTLTSSDWDKLNNPTFTQSVYSKFNLQPQTAIGGTEAGNLGGQSTGGGKSTLTETNKTATPQP